MRDTDLYARILNVQAPWTVEDVELDQSGGEVRGHVASDGGAPLVCPQYQQAVPGYDTRQRQWRHLDWSYRNRDSARNGWKRLLAWMARSRLQSMVKLGQTVRNHLWGILNAVMAGATKSLAEEPQ